jgi:hypothetical protein
MHGASMLRDVVANVLAGGSFMARGQPMSKTASVKIGELEFEIQSAIAYLLLSVSEERDEYKVMCRKLVEVLLAYGQKKPGDYLVRDFIDEIESIGAKMSRLLNKEM